MMMARTFPSMCWGGTRELKNIASSDSGVMARTSGRARSIRLRADCPTSPCHLPPVRPTSAVSVRSRLSWLFRSARIGATYRTETGSKSSVLICEIAAKSPFDADATLGIELYESTYPVVCHASPCHGRGSLRPSRTTIRRSSAGRDRQWHWGVSLAKFIEAFAREVFSEYGTLPVWPSDVSLRVGDILDIRDGLTRVRGNLSDLGVDFETRPGLGGTDMRLSWRVHRTAAVDMETGQLPTKIGVTVRTQAALAFEVAGAFVLHGTNMQTRQMVATQRVVDAISRAHQRREWSVRHVLVESLTTADDVDVVVSRSPRVLANIDLGAGVLAALPLLESAADWESAGGVAVHHRAKHGVLMYSALAYRSAWWGRDELRAVAPGSDTDGASASLDAVTNVGLMKLLTGDN